MPVPDESKSEEAVHAIESMTLSHKPLWMDTSDSEKKRTKATLEIPLRFHCSNVAVTTTHSSWRSGRSACECSGFHPNTFDRISRSTNERFFQSSRNGMPEKAWIPQMMIRGRGGNGAESRRPRQSLACHSSAGSFASCLLRYLLDQLMDLTDPRGPEKKNYRIQISEDVRNGCERIGMLNSRGLRPSWRQMLDLGTNDRHFWGF